MFQPTEPVSSTEYPKLTGGLAVEKSFWGVSGAEARISRSTVWILLAPDEEQQVRTNKNLPYFSMKASKLIL